MAWPPWGGGLCEREVLPSFLFLISRFESNHSGVLTGVRGEPRAAASSVKWTENRTPTWVGLGKGQGRGVPASLGRPGQTWPREVVPTPSHRTVGEGPGGLRRALHTPFGSGPGCPVPSAPPPRPPRSNRKYLSLSMFPPLACTQLSPALSRGDFQETHCEKPNDSQLAASSHPR